MRSACSPRSSTASAPPASSVSSRWASRGSSASTIPAGCFSPTAATALPASSFSPRWRDDGPSSWSYKPWSPRSASGRPVRSAVGIDSGRLAIALAVLAKEIELDLSDADVFASVVGGVRVPEPAADLALALAVVSAALRLVALPTGLAECGRNGARGRGPPGHQSPSPSGRAGPPRLRPGDRAGLGAEGSRGDRAPPSQLGPRRDRRSPRISGGCDPIAPRGHRSSRSHAPSS